MKKLARIIFVVCPALPILAGIIGKAVFRAVQVGAELTDDMVEWL